MLPFQAHVHTLPPLVERTRSNLNSQLRSHQAVSAIDSGRLRIGALLWVVVLIFWEINGKDYLIRMDVGFLMLRHRVWRSISLIRVLILLLGWYCRII